jgi:hypothetical protein
MKKLPVETEREFDDLILKAERHLKDKNYLLAKNTYEKALNIKRDNDLEQKIAKLEEIIQKIETIHSETF